MLIQEMKKEEYWTIKEGSFQAVIHRRILGMHVLFAWEYVYNQAWVSFFNGCFLIGLNKI